MSTKRSRPAQAPRCTDRSVQQHWQTLSTHCLHSSRIENVCNQNTFPYLVRYYLREWPQHVPWDRVLSEADMKAHYIALFEDKLRMLGEEAMSVEDPATVGQLQACLHRLTERMQSDPWEVLECLYRVFQEERTIIQSLPHKSDDKSKENATSPLMKEIHITIIRLREFFEFQKTCEQDIKKLVGSKHIILGSPDCTDEEKEERILQYVDEMGKLLTDFLDKLNTCWKLVKGHIRTMRETHKRHVWLEETINPGEVTTVNNLCGIVATHMCKHYELSIEGLAKPDVASWCTDTLQGSLHCFHELFKDFLQATVFINKDAPQNLRLKVQDDKSKPEVAFKKTFVSFEVRIILLGWKPLAPCMIQLPNDIHVRLFEEAKLATASDEQQPDATINKPQLKVEVIDIAKTPATKNALPQVVAIGKELKLTDFSVPKKETYRYATYGLRFDVKVLAKINQTITMLLPVYNYSNPISFVSHGTQSWQITGLHIWDAAFSLPDDERQPYECESEVSACALVNVLSRYCQTKTHRGLDEQQCRFLMAILPAAAEEASGASHQKMVQRDTFIQAGSEKKCRKGKYLSVWQWFYACLNRLSNKKTTKMWCDGIIAGFIDKKEASQLLAACPRGTFLIRLRETGRITSQKSELEAALALSILTDDCHEREIEKTYPVQIEAKDIEACSLEDYLKNVELKIGCREKWTSKLTNLLKLPGKELVAIDEIMVGTVDTNGKPDYYASGQVIKLECRTQNCRWSRSSMEASAGEQQSSPASTLVQSPTSTLQASPGSAMQSSPLSFGQPCSADMSPTFSMSPPDLLLSPNYGAQAATSGVPMCLGSLSALSSTSSKQSDQVNVIWSPRVVEQSYAGPASDPAKPSGLYSDSAMQPAQKGTMPAAQSGAMLSAQSGVMQLDSTMPMEQQSSQNLDLRSMQTTTAWVNQTTLEYGLPSAEQLHSLSDAQILEIIQSDDFFAPEDGLSVPATVADLMEQPSSH